MVMVVMKMVVVVSCLPCATPHRTSCIGLPTTFRTDKRGRDDEVAVVVIWDRQVWWWWWL